MNTLLRYLPSDRRQRWVWGGVAGALVLLFWLFSGSGEQADGRALTAKVERGPLTISLVESGTIRPRQQMVLTNETESTAAILWIAPEGSFVEAGELLVELNATAAETELVERRIRVQNAESNLVYSRENLSVVRNQGEADIEQAELNLLFAEKDLVKYSEGEHPMELMRLNSSIRLAEEELKQAVEQLRWSRVLAEEKYLSQAELERNELGTQKMTLNLELARRSLEVFETFTHVRQKAELESSLKQAGMALERARLKAAANIAQGEAALRAAEAELEEDRARMGRVEERIAKARVYAPIAGMVLYASSVSNRWNDNDDRIQEGAMVKERGEIIYLPTASTYDVDIQISEANLEKVKEGQRVRLTTDAMPDTVLTGRIARVARLPDSRSRFLNPNLKLYNTVIELDPVEVPLRNGMSGRAEIMIEQHADALFVPVQCIARHGGLPVLHVVENGRTRPVEVKIGLDNNRVVHVIGGVSAGTEVLLAPPFDGVPPTAEERWQAGDESEVAGETQTPAVARGPGGGR